MPATTLFDLIRHGESASAPRYLGQTDDPLSEKGWRQMRKAVANHHPWTLIVSSTLSRCLAFAEELSQRHDLVLEQEPRLKEIGFGCWEGLSADEISWRDPDALMRFYQNPIGCRPEGAEPLDQFRLRILAVWDDMLTRHKGKHVLVVTHAGVVRMVMAHVLDIPLRSLFRIKVANAAMTRIQCDSNGAERVSQLLFHGGVL